MNSEFTEADSRRLLANEAELKKLRKRIEALAEETTLLKTKKKAWLSTSSEGDAFVLPAGVQQPSKPPAITIQPPAVAARPTLLTTVIDSAAARSVEVLYETPADSADDDAAAAMAAAAELVPVVQQPPVVVTVAPPPAQRAGPSHDRTPLSAAEADRLRSSIIALATERCKARARANAATANSPSIRSSRSLDPAAADYRVSRLLATSSLAASTKLTESLVTGVQESPDGRSATRRRRRLRRASPPPVSSTERRSTSPSARSARSSKTTNQSTSQKSPASSSVPNSSQLSDRPSFNLSASELPTLITGTTSSDPAVLSTGDGLTESLNLSNIGSSRRKRRDGSKSGKSSRSRRSKSPRRQFLMSSSTQDEAEMERSTGLKRSMSSGDLHQMSLNDDSVRSGGGGVEDQLVRTPSSATFLVGVSCLYARAPSMCALPVGDASSSSSSSSSTTPPSPRPAWLDEQTTPTIPSGKTSWNLRFQRALDRLRKVQASESPSLAELRDVNAELLHLNQDFIHTSTVYGRIIISEMYLPNNEKTLRPNEQIGGAAGGQKYVVHDILFKFAIDVTGLYGGDHIAAAKVAGHELKGLMAYLSCDMPDVNFPLMALIDYLGFRLIAISLLPISNATLIYGSNDGGKTVRAANPAFNGYMKSAGRQMNLRQHRSGSHSIWSCADIEGHLGSDGKFYLLDFSRTMPPVRPAKNVPQAHLFQLFRRNFVQSYPRPLCSDAFSGFAKLDPSFRAMNQDIVEASDYLEQQLCPRFAEELAAMLSKTTMYDKFNVCAELHIRGINIRYAGLVYNRAHELVERDPHTPGMADAKLLLLLEALARALKNALRRRLQQMMKTLALPLEIPYRRVIIEFINQVFGSPYSLDEELQQGRLYADIAASMHRWFHFRVDYLPNVQRDLVLYGEKSGWQYSPRQYLFKRLCRMTGMVFSERAKQRFKGLQRWFSKEPVDLLDLIQVGHRCKYTNVVSLAEGSFFELKAQLLEQTRASGDSDAVIEDYFAQALQRYRMALSSTPADPGTLFLCARAARRLLAARQRQQQAGRPAEEKTLRASIEGFYRSLLSMCPNDASFMAEFAAYLDDSGDEAAAESYYLHSLSVDPLSLAVLRSYGRLLERSGRRADGRSVLQLAELVVDSFPPRQQQQQSLVDVFVSIPSPLNTPKVGVRVSDVATVDEIIDVLVHKLLARTRLKRDPGKYALLAGWLRSFDLFVHDADDTPVEQMLQRHQRPGVTHLHRPAATLIFKPRSPRAVDTLLQQVACATPSVHSANPSAPLFLEKLKSLVSLLAVTPFAETSVVAELAGSPPLQTVSAAISEAFEPRKPGLRLALRKPRKFGSLPWLLCNLWHAALLTLHLCAAVDSDCDCPDPLGQTELRPQACYQAFAAWLAKDVHRVVADLLAGSAPRDDAVKTGQQMAERLFLIYSHLLVRHESFLELVHLIEPAMLAFMHLHQTAHCELLDHKQFAKVLPQLNTIYASYCDWESRVLKEPTASRLTIMTVLVAFS